MSQIVEYSVTDLELDNLAKKYAKVPDAATKEGYQAIKACLKETTPLRTAVERRRKELKADALEYGRKVDSEAKRITQALVAIETPYREAKSVIDDAIARAEEEKRIAEENRIRLLQERIQFINQQSEGLLGASTAKIQERIDWLTENASLDTFDEYTEQAESANNKVLTTLNNAMSIAINMEKQQAEQARIAKAQAEQQAELDRQAVEQRKQQEAIEAERNEAARVMREAQEKAQAEQRRIEAEKLAKERAEKERLQAELDAKEKAEREAKAAIEALAAEEAETERIAAMAPDKVKLRSLAKHIDAIKLPEMTSPEGKKLLDIVVTQLSMTSQVIIDSIGE